MENCLLPSVDLFYSEQSPWIFQQDGAPAHTAHSITGWFNENKITVLPWCPRSPDLNPIENIWCWMDKQLRPITIRSIEQLKEEVEALWLKVPTEMCIKLIESMPKRVKACYLAKGGHIKY